MPEGGYFYSVEKEILERFRKLSYSQRLQWLEEVHRFIKTALPQEKKKIMELLRKGKPVFKN